MALCHWSRSGTKRIAAAQSGIRGSTVNTRGKGKEKKEKGREKKKGNRSSICQLTQGF
jgi:hypothetical protein